MKERKEKNKKRIRKKKGMMNKKEEKNWLICTNKWQAITRDDCSAQSIQISYSIPAVFWSSVIIKYFHLEIQFLDHCIHLSWF